MLFIIMVCLIVGLAYNWQLQLEAREMSDVITDDLKAKSISSPCHHMNTV
jgi:hypothetical protein